jgi:hypothetical protein
VLVCRSSYTQALAGAYRAHSAQKKGGAGCEPGTAQEATSEAARVTNKRVSENKTWRKATLKSFLRDRQAVKKDAARAIKKARDADDVAKWRALRKIGAYSSTATPAVSRLTPARRKAITRAFNQVQGFAAFRDGATHRPLQQVVQNHQHAVRDKDGRLLRMRTTQKSKYVLDDYFAVLKPKTPINLSGVFKTNNAVIVPKPHKGSRVQTRNGKIEIRDYVGSQKFKITREGITGSAELLTLAERIKNKQIKLKKNEGLRLISNGSMKRSQGFLFDDIDSLADLILRYRDEFSDNFDDWADHAEIIVFSR